MANAVRLTTTGTPATVTINDLGGITFVHPVVNEDLVSPDGFLDYESVLESLENGDLGASEIAGEIILTDANGNTISPGSDALTFVSLTQTETIQGTKTFNSDRIIIDPTDTGTTTQFQLGWFNDLTPADPNSFGFRRVDGGGVISWMNNANFPQIFAGSPTGTGETFIDATNNRPLNINVLDTGVDDPGRVTIGIGGLTVEGSSEISPTNPLTVFRDDTVPILSFEVESDGTLTAGVTASYEALVLATNDIPNKGYTDGNLGGLPLDISGLSAGDIIFYDGVGFETTTSLKLETAGCSILTEDETGLDWCNFQVGSAGSAFTVLKKAQGTLALPTVLNNGDKIGGWGFIAFDDATSNPGYVSLEIAGYATETQSAIAGGAEMRFLVTTNGTKTTFNALKILNDGTITVEDQTDYELLVTGDDVVPNKKYVDDRAPYSIIRLTDNGGTDLTANYNINGAEVPMVLTGTALNVGSASTDFTDVNGTVTCNFTGVVKVTYNVPNISTGARNSLKAIIQLNGVNYGAPTHGYIRNSTGHNKDNNVGSDFVSVSATDTINIGLRRSEGSTNGTATNLLAGVNFSIERIQ